MMCFLPHFGQMHSTFDLSQPTITSSSSSGFSIASSCFMDALRLFDDIFKNPATDGITPEVVSKHRIAPAGKAPADSAATPPRQVVSIAGGRQHRHRVSDDVMKPLLNETGAPKKEESPGHYSNKIFRKRIRLSCLKPGRASPSLFATAPTLFLESRVSPPFVESLGVHSSPVKHRQKKFLMDGKNGSAIR